nr:hypothetical protein [Tanacetum cinerariifolium]
MNSEIVMRIDHSLARQGYQTDEKCALSRDRVLEPLETDTLLVRRLAYPAGLAQNRDRTENRA